ncbi:MAG TPA: hypothetical protein VM681_05085 [Candidatus Thermoplasmatota archaeon]|nr:hypothetical protein [Candidatus Thermoplasmatota archaeon]
MRPRIATRAWAAGIVLAVALAAVPAAAHENPNHGTIKVHDDEVVSPPQRNDPRVDCDFWIEGFKMTNDEGWLVFYEWPPTGDKSEVLRADWEADAEDTPMGFHFKAGPFSLPSGHYRVEAYVDEGHFAKAKMFWTDCEEDDGNGGNGGPPPPPECPPTELEAVANADGTISVTVMNEGAVFVLYRSVDGGDWEHVTEMLDGSTVVDGPYPVGTVVDYGVRHFDGRRVTAEFCATASATAIPFFTSPLAAAGAALGGLGAYAFLRRRP